LRKSFKYAKRKKGFRRKPGANGEPPRTTRLARLLDLDQGAARKFAFFYRG
jgi:hypothetical protein